MPTGRQDLAAAVVYNSLGRPTLYAIGGISESGLTLAKVEAYDFETDTWSLRSPLPVPLGETNGARVIGNKIYISGGRDLQDETSGFPRNTLYVYDPATDRWSRKADMPAPSLSGVSGVIDGKLYVLTAEASNSFFRYDPVTDSWSSLPNTLNGRFRAAGAVVKGKFYVAGGEKFSSDGPYAIKKLHVYDPAANKWSAKALMPRGVYEAAGARLLGQFYVLGGIGTNRVHELVQAYDPATDTWALKTSLPQPRGGFAAANVVLEGRQAIATVGGFAGSTINEVYTP
jgi:N-acetylneuraminic acid mutarotase